MDRGHVQAVRAQVFPAGEDWVTMGLARPTPEVCATGHGLGRQGTLGAGSTRTPRPALPRPKLVPVPTHPCGSRNLRPELKGVLGMSDVETD